MSEKNISIMDDLMQVIIQTEEWETIQATDPAIRKADKEITTLLCEAKSHVPKALYLKLEDAVYNYSNAVSDAAILYGIHVADAIRDVSARPQDLSRHVLGRDRKSVV